MSANMETRSELLGECRGLGVAHTILHDHILARRDDPLAVALLDAVRRDIHDTLEQRAAQALSNLGGLDARS